MDYGNILKRAWDVTWRYKILWLFGFFAGGAGGASGGGGNRYNVGSGSRAVTGAELAQIGRFLSQYLGVLVLGLVVFVFIAFLIGTAIAALARGGLVYLVNEAEEGREVRAGAGWSAGASKWGRTYGVILLTGLPVLILVLVILGMGASALAAAATAIASGSTQAFARSFGAAFAGGACLAVIVGIIAIFVGLVLGIVSELAVRYVVLHNRGVGDSIRQGWNDLFSKRGAFLMWLVLLGVGIAFGIAIGIVGGILAVVPFLLFIIWPVLLVVGAVYAAFYHSVWTIFFRRMTGMEPAPAVAAGYAPPSAYPAAPPVAYAPPGYPPQPPVAYAPPAPPVPPAPPAPEMPAPPAPPAPSAPEMPAPPVPQTPPFVPEAPAPQVPPAPPVVPMPPEEPMPPAPPAPPAPTDG